MGVEARHGRRTGRRRRSLRVAGAQAPAEGQAVLRDGPKARAAWPHSARIQVGRAAGSSRGGPALLQPAPRSGTRHWRRRKQARQGAAGRFPREHVRLSAGLSRRSPPAGDARGVGGWGAGFGSEKQIFHSFKQRQKIHKSQSCWGQKKR